MIRSLAIPLLLLAAPLRASSPHLPADEAAAIRSYAVSGTAPVLHTGSTRRYPYGLRTPVLHCAPLRVCAVVLEAGETVWDVLSGDTAQWQTFEAATGPERQTPVVAIKPRLEPGRICDKTTNLVITTDRRIYHVVLHLPKCSRSDANDLNPDRPYDAVVSFYYPEETLARWNAESRAAKRTEQLEEASATPLAAGTTAIEDLNWDYSFRRKRPRFPWLPAAVFDDGARTYVRLPEGASEAPAPFALEETGELSLLNHRLDGNLLILDRVLKSFALTLPGPKKKPRKLIITNDSWREER